MIARGLQRGLVGEVRALFNESGKAERVITRSPHALMPPDSVAWRVHGDVTTMMIGGVSALLLQMLHPVAVAGVWDHSNFRADMLGRLRRTAHFMAATTYAHADIANDAIARVNGIHARVGGTLPDGTVYRANEPRVLAWVHVAGAISFVDAWIRFGEPGMSRGDQDQYFADVAGVARAMGADPVPETRFDADRLIVSFRPELRADDRSHEISHLVLQPGTTKLRAAPVQSIMKQAAIDLLPPWARTMHGLRASFVTRPAVDVAAFGLANTIRWAFESVRS